MENVIPQWWIVNIVFLFSEAQTHRTRTCRSRRWVLPCLSSNQITQISLCVHSVCPFIWASSCSWICSDWRIYQAQRSQNNTAGFARLKCNSHSLEDKRMQMVGYGVQRNINHSDLGCLHKSKMHIIHKTKRDFFFLVFVFLFMLLAWRFGERTCLVFSRLQ